MYKDNGVTSLTF